MGKIRNPAVAGSFYPGRPDALRRSVESFLRPSEKKESLPKAVVAPHAGYQYSGPVAGTAYSLFPGQAAGVKRLALFGPSHRVALRGLALCGAEAFRTPLGDMNVDHSCDEALLKISGVRVMDAAHAQEHSLEAQVPFMQVVFEGASLVPVVVGDAEPDGVAAAMEILCARADTLLVVSTDLSHYLNYEDAKKMDRATTDAILSLCLGEIPENGACGINPLRGLIELAKRKKLRPRLLDLRNSADTAGPAEQVVGYGAYAFFE